jgi:hypothetical protein
MLDEAAKFFVSQGVLGAGLLVLGVAYYRKDRECAELHAARIASAERQIEILATAKARTEAIVDKYESLVEERAR